jgi:protein TonB
VRLGEEGRVVLNVDVTADGLVEQVSVYTSSGHPRLDEAAMKTVRQWKFVPFRRGDQAMAKTWRVPVNFNLEEQ